MEKDVSIDVPGIKFSDSFCMLKASAFLSEEDIS